MTRFVQYMAKVFFVSLFACAHLSLGAMEKDDHKIFKAIENGDEEAIRKMLVDFDHEMTNSDGDPALFVAVRVGTLSVVKLVLKSMIEKKVNVNIQNDRNLLAIDIVFRVEQPNSEILEYLLQNGVEPWITKKYAMSGCCFATTLHDAARLGISFIKPLIEYGADISCIDPYSDETPLCKMLKCGDLESIKFIFDFYDDRMRQICEESTFHTLWKMCPHGGGKNLIADTMIFCLWICKQQVNKYEESVPSNVFAIGFLPREIFLNIFKYMLTMPLFVAQRNQIVTLVQTALQRADENIYDYENQRYEAWSEKMKELDSCATNFELMDSDYIFVPEEQEENVEEVIEDDNFDPNEQAHRILFNDQEFGNDNSDEQINNYNDSDESSDSNQGETNFGEVD